MKKAIIVLTDPLSSGGSVVQTQQQKFKIDNLPVATLGDEVSCPIPLHGSTKIVEGYEKFKINVLPIALHGHKVGCGCTLVGKQCVGKAMVSKPDKVNIIPDTIEKIKKYDEQLKLKIKMEIF